jgi:putative tricarboxylic transport membrane protein
LSKMNIPIFESIGYALQLIFTWQTVLAIFFGAFLGIFVGAIPGLTGVMTIALVLPFTLFVSPWVGIPLLVSIYKSSMYGGSISAILIRTPGNPAAAMTAIDGHALKQKGQAKKALQAALYFSFGADFFSDMVLITVAPILALVALKFGPPEFFLLIVFSLIIISFVAGKSMVKGLIAAALGLLFGAIGLDPITSGPRLCFGNVDLMAGLEFMPLLIGLFAISECIFQIEGYFSRKRYPRKTASETSKEDSGIIQSKERLTFKEMRGYVKTWFRSAAIGTIIGVFPGVGGSVAPFVAYNAEQRRSKHPERLGTGAMEGVIASESANNAVCGANLIPLLTLGIPGDVTAAMLMGALMVHGLMPGPLLFKETPHVIYAIYASLLLANFVYLLVGSFYIKIAIQVTRVSTQVLVPIIIVLCIAGSYAFNRSFFDVKVMIIFGLVGYAMRKLDYSLPSFLIAFILSPMLETSFRRSLLLSDGSMAIFLQRPVSMILVVLLVAFILRSLIVGVRSLKKESPPNARGI